MPRILVIGMGYVGNVVFNFFDSHYEVHGYDPYHNGFSTKPEGKFDLAVICVPTQPLDDGSADTSIVEEVLEWVNADVCLIRSTIPPGTTDNLKKKTGKRIVFSPEYAGEGNYWSPYPFDKDEKQVPYYIFGGPPEDCQHVIDLYIPITGPKKKYRTTTARTAEVVKYIENLYFAWKVSYANEVKEMCDAMGVPYWEARDLWALDPRVDEMHTAVFPNNRGFGGKCLPKDTLAYYNWSKKAGYMPEVTKKIIEVNMKRREGKGEYHDGLKL